MIHVVVVVLLLFASLCVSCVYWHISTVLTVRVCVCVAPGLMSARLSSLDDSYREAFPGDGQWMAALQDSAGTCVT